MGWGGGSRWIHHKSIPVSAVLQSECLEGKEHSSLTLITKKLNFGSEMKGNKFGSEMKGNEGKQNMPLFFGMLIILN